MSTMFQPLQYFPKPSQPYIFCPSLALFVLAYYTMSPSYATQKQKAWVLTALSSLCMTLFSLPFVLDYIAGGLSVHAIRHTRMSTLAQCANIVFQAYLVADLIIGALHYRKHVNLLSGWVHHFLYIFVNELALRRSWAHIFALCSIMELPTFILALGTLHPTLRADLLFGFSFFGTRIVLHLLILVAYVKESNRIGLLDGSMMPAAVLALAFGMHVMWFVQCVKGNLRRWKKRAGEKETKEVLCVEVDAKKEKGIGEGEVGVRIFDLSNLEGIFEPAPSSAQAVLFYSSLPELHRSLAITPESGLGSGAEGHSIFSSCGELTKTTRALTMPVSSYSEIRTRSTATPSSTYTPSSKPSTLGSRPVRPSSLILHIPRALPPSPSPPISSPSQSPPTTNALSTPSPTQRPPFARLPSVERALQALQALRAQARTRMPVTVDRVPVRIRGIYERLPDRRALYDYVGLNGGRMPMKEVRAY